jgi:hypothetical protein
MQRSNRKPSTSLTRVGRRQSGVDRSERWPTLAPIGACVFSTLLPRASIPRETQMHHFDATPRSVLRSPWSRNVAQGVRALGALGEREAASH